jgi:hypothetical protein
MEKIDTTILISSTQDAIFPAITICPSYDVGYKKDKLRQYGLAANDVRNSIKFPKNLSTSLSKFFEEITYDVTDIVHYIDVGCGKQLEGSNYTYFKFTTETNQNGTYSYLIT